MSFKLQCMQLDNHLNENLLTYYPSQLRMELSASVTDHSVSKRLLTCVLAALRAHGSFLTLVLYSNYFDLYYLL